MLYKLVLKEFELIQHKKLAIYQGILYGLWYFTEQLTSFAAAQTYYNLEIITIITIYWAPTMYWDPQ